MSLDGYLGDQHPRLAFSNEADFDRVDEVRASCDAIMVGAATGAPTTPGCSCARRPAATSAWPAGSRRLR